MELTYSISATNNGNNNFYKDIAGLTDFVSTQAVPLFKVDIERYQQFIIDANIEECRSFDEYLLEIIMIGVLWRSYENEAKRTPIWQSRLLYKLYLVRKNNPKLKKTVDKVRGKMMTPMLYNKPEGSNLYFTGRSFGRLIGWLNATGEFFEETRRITNWFRYTKLLSASETDSLLKKAYDFAGWFEEVSKDKLGAYTRNVNPFIEKAKTEYRQREDYGLATRKEIEYHFNMVAAEILNRALRGKFMEAKRKVVLLPTCMRIVDDHACKAKPEGSEKKCICCHSQCNVGKVSASLKNYQIDAYLIPHSSNFSKTLKRWKEVPDVSLVGVACVLNLLLGGYEMISLGIPSQCVYLDFCGCKKHWDKKGIPTSLNTGHLLHILGVKEQHNKGKEQIALVNMNDEITGFEEKMRVHQKGLLHRAFSILIFNRKGELMLHRRAMDKYHSGGLWTNTCCSHLTQEERMDSYVHTRLQYEMGFDCELTFVKKFHYRIDFSYGMIENEIDHIYAGLYDKDPKPNSAEVCEWMWCDIKHLQADMDREPEKYTYWFKNIMVNHLEEAKNLFLSRFETC
ncbi:MAG: isopentenyl-diphosphate Delta-isomerase [Bacteroidales bacterium]|jgi:isopentenyl-diphosphate delta-isomerase type 1|nr:isopentenyl-diphosphate Delta-isomerase [Bacteroidales bacterium]